MERHEKLDIVEHICNHCLGGSGKIAVVSLKLA